MSVEKITFEKLRQMGFEDKWKRAVIVFDQKSFTKPYSETERSYEVSSDNHCFCQGRISNSIHGFCLDGHDNGVRLDRYMYDCNWTVEYCYILE